MAKRILSSLVLASWVVSFGITAQAAPATDGTTSHSTKRANNARQVAGYNTLNLPVVANPAASTEFNPAQKFQIQQAGIKLQLSLIQHANQPEGNQSC